MSIIRLRTAKLIVRLRWSRTISGWSTRQVLKLTTPSIVAKENVELAIWSKAKHAAVVIAARRLCFVTLVGRNRRSVVLKRTQHDQVVVKRQRRSIPGKTIDAVSDQRHLKYFFSVGSKHVCIETSRLVGKERISRQSRAATGPVQIDAGVRREIRMSRDAQQPAFRSKVHAEIQHGSLLHTSSDSLHLAVVLLENQEVVVADE